MSCISPLTILPNKKVREYFEVPCGQCLNCRIKKQAEIQFLAQKELLYNYLSGKSASFVTLTYDDSHIPLTEEEKFTTLRRKDVQNFIKNMRRQIDYYNFNLSFKYLYCGEYGDGSHSTSKTGVSTCRPHYHIIFIGLSPEQVKAFTKKLWKFGLCDVGPLGAGGIRYLTKYLLKTKPDKDVKAFRLAAGVENPFFYHSVGIGKQWIIDNLDKIVEDDFCFNLNGKKYLFPRYVLRFVASHTGTNYVPYVKKFMNYEYEHSPESKTMSFNQYQFEKSFISYKYKISALRSQNKPVNDITLSKAWVRPFSSSDRVPRKLAESAYYGDVVPF